MILFCSSSLLCQTIASRAVRSHRCQSRVESFYIETFDGTVAYIHISCSLQDPLPSLWDFLLQDVSASGAFETRRSESELCLSRYRSAYHVLNNTHTCCICQALQHLSEWWSWGSHFWSLKRRFMIGTGSIPFRKWVSSSVSPMVYLWQ